MTLMCPCYIKRLSPYVTPLAPHPFRYSRRLDRIQIRIELKDDVNGFSFTSVICLMSTYHGQINYKDTKTKCRLY
jgi:hypothetical protein